MKTNRASTIKEHQGRRSKELGNTKRFEVFLKIAQKPRSFTELLKETDLKSPKSLSNHLKSLKTKGVIERAIINDREVYKVKIFDSRRIIKELETDLFFPFLIRETLSYFVPDLRAKIDEIINEMAMNIIKKGQETLAKGKEQEIPKEIPEAYPAKEANENDDDSK